MNALLPLLLALGALLADESGREHVGLAASFEREQSGGEAHVVVRFMPLQGAVQVNADPAPRLQLPADQDVLEESQRPVPPPPRAAFPNARYIDTHKGVSFPVRLGRQARPGPHVVRARVTFFYCSTAEGWCRRATDEVDIGLTR